MSSSPDLAIVSANFGGCDEVFAHEPQDIPVEWIYFTDSQDLDVPGRKVVRLQPNGLHPCLAAKRFKLQPPVAHRFVIWIDANIRIQSSQFAREALTYIEDGLAVHRHPFRDCIYQEAVETILTPKYDGLPIAEQVRHYHRGDQYHPRSGLYACGVIAWDREHPKVDQFGRAWMHECERWTWQDQLSFPVICKRLGIKPGVFPHDQYESPWFRVERHR